MRKSTKLGLDAGDLYRMHLRQTMDGQPRGKAGPIAVMLDGAAAARRELGKPSEILLQPEADAWRKRVHAVFVRRARAYRTGAEVM